MIKPCAFLSGLFVLAGCVSSATPPLSDGPGGAARGFPATFRALNPDWAELCEDAIFRDQRVAVAVRTDSRGRLLGEPRLVEPSDVPGYDALAGSIVTWLRAREPFYDSVGPAQFTLSLSGAQACADPA